MSWVTSFLEVTPEYFWMMLYWPLRWSQYALVQPGLIRKPLGLILCGTLLNSWTCSGKPRFSSGSAREIMGPILELPDIIRELQDEILKWLGQPWPDPSF